MEDTGRQRASPRCQLGAGRGVLDLECFWDRSYPKDAEVGGKCREREGLPGTLGHEEQEPRHTRHIRLFHKRTLRVNMFKKQDI